MKKKILVFCMFLFTATFLFAGNGILRVSANMSDVDIYNGDEQIAMLGQEHTDIELPKGKYTIVLKKPIDEEKEYFASKSVFVGSNAVVRVKFDLEKRLTLKGLEQKKIREEKIRIEKELAEEKRRIEKQKKEEQKKNSFKSQDLEKIGLEIKYTVENNIVRLIVASSSLEESGKGGISISFPQFLNDSKILEKKFTGFDEVKNYPKGSKLWNNDLKKSIKSSYLLIEGWHNSWNKKEIKEIHLTINAENLDNLEVRIRTNIIKNKNEFLNPSYGYKNEQGYYDKIINIGIKNKVNNHINTFLSKWDEAHNLKNKFFFDGIYSENIKYYNIGNVSKKYVLEDKIKKLKENADFKQSSTIFDIVKLNDNTYKVFLDKYNYFNKKSKKINSYLVIKDIGNNKFEIIEEGDSPSKKVKIEQQNINTIKSKITELKSQGFEDKGSYILPPMVKIKAGTFQMGSNINDNEKPIHEVNIKNDFYMGKYEVTFAEYDKFCEDTNRKKPDDGGFGRGSKPVINVSWNDANEYAKWLSQKTGQNYKLPSETQWEYATKAGTNTKYSFGDDENKLAQYAWYNKNSYDKGKNHSDYGTHNIGSKKPNPLGLYDVHGNVWEWIDDWYVDNYKNTSWDENSNIKGEQKYKVVRGGSWYYYANNTRTAYRSFNRPANSFNDIGFRLSRTLP